MNQLRTQQLAKITEMGTWTLEVGKMALYTSFPVMLFYYFNQPAYFEEWVTKTKREIYPPENLEQKEAIANLIKEMRSKHAKTME